MTPEQRRAILALSIVPGERTPRGSQAEVLAAFGANEGVELSLELLQDSVQRRDATDLSYALATCFEFGVSLDHFVLLEPLIVADWHKSHEDVVAALDQLRTPLAIDVLAYAITHRPDYLACDANPALAIKAVWALGKIEDERARLALEYLLDSVSPLVKEAMELQLGRQ